MSDLRENESCQELQPEEFFIPSSLPTHSMVSPMLGLDGETTSKMLNANSDDGMGESEGVEEIEVS